MTDSLKIALWWKDLLTSKERKVCLNYTLQVCRIREGEPVSTHGLETYSKRAEELVTQAAQALQECP